MTMSDPNFMPVQIFKEYGVLFQNIDLLSLALTHASRNRTVNNERLEFLGDRVIGLVLADTLYHLYPLETEGQMALRHASLVRTQTMAYMARTLSLETALQLSAHDRAAGTGGLENVLADAMEAAIGALYLDQGMAVCARLVETLWAQAIKEMTLPPQDPKTALQEWAQARGLPLPVYTIAARRGPDHAPVFVMQVGVKGYPPVTAEGASRRTAEKLAASTLLCKLQAEEPAAK